MPSRARSAFFSLALAACSSNPAPSPDFGAGPVTPGDASVVDGAVSPQLGDLGPLEVSCGGLNLPYLVVTHPPSGPDTTLVRVALRFSHAATEVTISSVSQLSSDMPATTLRTWDATQLAGPPGWSGTATPDVGQTAAVVVWTGTASALAVESSACTLPPWQRPGGTLHVVGSTHEGGAFATDCSYSLRYNGALPEKLPLACAAGVAGWVDDVDLNTTTTPIVALTVYTGVHVYDLAGTALDGITATGATVYGHAGVPMPGCSTGDPAPWTLSGGDYTLWRGSGSMQVWDGPVTPGAQVDANLLYALNGGVPMAGFCPMGATGPMSCPPRLLQIALSGNSSAGAYRFESSLFDCTTH
jgi:hypothetical protein